MRWNEINETLRSDTDGVERCDKLLGSQVLKICCNVMSWQLLKSLRAESQLLQTSHFCRVKFSDRSKTLCDIYIYIYDVK